MHDFNKILQDKHGFLSHEEMIMFLCDNYVGNIRIAAVEVSESETGRSIMGAAYNIREMEFYLKFGGELMTFNIVTEFSEYFCGKYRFEVWLF